MKNILYFNYLFVGTPIVLGLLGFLYNPLWFFAAVTPILTGLFQVVQALCLYNDKNYRDIPLAIYFAVTILFFILWINTSWQWIWGLPPLLAIYLTVIFFIEAKKEKS